VLNNDTDGDTTRIGASWMLNRALHGALALASDGSFHTTPAANFTQAMTALRTTSTDGTVRTRNGPRSRSTSSRS
jgi:hypothetical protein